MKRLLDRIRRLLGLQEELERLKAKLDTTSEHVQQIQDELNVYRVDFYSALKVLTDETGSNYTELRQDLNTFTELYSLLDSRVQAAENILPETLTNRELRPVANFRTFRTLRRELEAKHSRRIVDESKPQTVPAD